MGVGLVYLIARQGKVPDPCQYGLRYMLQIVAVKMVCCMRTSHWVARVSVGLIPCSWRSCVSRYERVLIYGLDHLFSAPGRASQLRCGEVRRCQCLLQSAVGDHRHVTLVDRTELCPSFTLVYQSAACGQYCVSGDTIGATITYSGSVSGIQSLRLTGQLAGLLW